MEPLLLSSATYQKNIFYILIVINKMIKQNEII